MTQFKRLRESEWEINFAKRCKVTSLLSTRFSNEINDKKEWEKNFAIKFEITSLLLARFFGKIDEINFHNKITTGHVNDDCLAEIFMYVPACERPKIALVCKQWKRVLDEYSWFNVKKLELTHWENDDKYSNYLFKNYPTVSGQYNFLKSLLNKCGRHLTELDLTAYSHCNIVPVINEYCPNLVKLRIRIKYIEDEMLDNAFTGLSKLKVLKIIFQCFLSPGTYIPVNLINSLLNVADTLTELNLSNWSGCMENDATFPEEFTRVISELKVLEKVQFAGISFLKSLVDYFILRNPKLLSYKDERKYRENRMSSTKIYKDNKKLDVRTSRVTDDFLYNVANQMRQLYALQIECERITDAGVVAISKMNYLRLLDFKGYNNVTDSSIKLLKNMMLLALPFSKKITNESAIKVLENSPDMYYFRVMNTSVTSEFIKKADEISRNRKKKLKVIISCEDNMPDTQSEYEYLTVDYVKKRDTTK